MQAWLEQTLRRRRRRKAVRRALRMAAILALLGAPSLALMAALVAGPALAGGTIWTFTDASGVVHFTNVPQGRQYQPLADAEFSPRTRVPQHWQYDGIIGRTAREQQVQPALVKAVIAAESNFDASAVSHKGAQGLMQLMPGTAAALGVGDPFQPIDNVRGGTAYLRQMLDRFGDVEHALAAYNAGPAAVDRFGGIPPYRETRAYVRRVLAYYRHYHGDFSR
jgi:soluble lytic murein transglycosylase-like protein